MEIESLGKIAPELQKVEGDLDLRANPHLKDFGNLQQVIGTLHLSPLFREHKNLPSAGKYNFSLMREQIKLEKRIEQRLEGEDTENLPDDFEQTYIEQFYDDTGMSKEFAQYIIENLIGAANERYMDYQDDHMSTDRMSRNYDGPDSDWNL